MASFEKHCQDCERLLGGRFETVNRWMDEMFRTLGTKHRRIRHHRLGVWEAHRLFGNQGAKAAIVHIVRDCGAVPREHDYDQTALGIILAPEWLMYDGENEKAEDELKVAIVGEWRKWDERNNCL